MSMSKIVIEIYVPSIDSMFDVSIPCNATIFELLPLMIVAVTRLSQGHFISNNAILCNGNTGVILSNNMSVNDLKLENGSRLILI